MSAPSLWTIDDMAAATGAERQGALPATISGLSIDTRTIGEGDQPSRRRRFARQPAPPKRLRGHLRSALEPAGMSAPLRREGGHARRSLWATRLEVADDLPSLEVSPPFCVVTLVRKTT